MLDLELQKLGIHRSKEPAHVLPQAAYKVDNSLPISETEILFEIDSLNIDSASFRNLLEISENSESKLKQKISEIVKERGKMHNPQTNSGGVFKGKIKQIGNIYNQYHQNKYQLGSKVVSLTSLTFTPLYLEEIYDVDIKGCTVFVKGYAILFLNSPFAVIDGYEIQEEIIMKVLDVAGAPAQVARYTKLSSKVVILGSGKSSILASYEAMKRVGPTGKVIVISNNQEELDYFLKNHLCHEVILSDATDPIQTYQKYLRTNDQLADLVVNCTNVPDTEATTILLTKDFGISYFFSMATSFQKAALQAEGLAKNVELIIGNGYYPDHYKIALNCLIENPHILEFFKIK